MFPTHRFAYVESDISRGGYPLLKTVAFLKTLNLKTILSLTPEPIDPIESIESIHIMVEKPKEENVPLTFSKVNQAIAILMDPSKLPIYVHCLDGTFVTSVLIACFRKTQTYSVSAILAEAQRFGKEEVLSSEEVDFITKFDGESCRRLKKVKKERISVSVPDLEVGEEIRLSRTIVALDLEMG